MPVAETQSIDILDDAATQKAATKVQTRVRGLQARRKVDDIKTQRITTMVGTLENAIDLAKKTKPGQSKLRLKSDEEIHEHAEMNSATVSKARKKLEAERNLPWTQRNSFSMAVGFFIFLNAVCMGVEVDYGTKYPDVFLIIEHFFTAVFLVELLCHFFVVGPRTYFKDSMNWLDFSLVTVSIIDVWVIAPLGVEADMRMMSLLRMLRLIRLARLLRLFRMFKELTLLVNGFVASVKTLFWTLVFLLIVVYTFSIFARQAIGDGDYEFSDDITFGDDTRLFGSLDKTMLTLFVCLTEGCGMDIVHPSVVASPALIIFWSMFIFFTTYGLLNLIVGCFCENAMKISSENEKEILENRDQQRFHILRHMQEAFTSMDLDGTGTISKKEFTIGILNNRAVMDAFTELGLDSEENLFEVLDSDNEGLITFDQFFDGASLIMKGQEAAKAKDIVSTQLTTRSMQRRMRHMDHQIHGLRKDMNMLIKTLLQQPGPLTASAVNLPVTPVPLQSGNDAEVWIPYDGGPLNKPGLESKTALPMGAGIAVVRQDDLAKSRDIGYPGNPNAFNDRQGSAAAPKTVSLSLPNSNQDQRQGERVLTMQPMPEPDAGTPTAVGQATGPSLPPVKPKTVHVGVQVDLFSAETPMKPQSATLSPPASAGGGKRGNEATDKKRDTCGNRMCGDGLWSGLK